ncbi:MAG: T9SS type A sorting domain-containing protein [Ilyomonas sp.]
MKKVYSFAFACLSVVLTGYTSFCQSVLDPNDPIVEYHPGVTYPQPKRGQIGKWIRTSHYYFWNTDSYKAYIYKGVAFRLKFPKTYDPAANDGKLYPMIVLFHGYGEIDTITDNEFQLRNGGREHKNAVDNGVFDGYVLFMQCQDYWHNYHSKYLTEIIDYMVTNNKLDPFRVSVEGISGGAWFSWKTLFAHPQYVDDILPMSGVSAGYKNSSKTEIYKYTPVWCFQGAKDIKPSPATAHKVRDVLVKIGADFRYNEYNTGHTTWDSAWKESDFFPFMVRAYASNPWPLYGKTDFPNYPINVTIGVSPGYNAYEWRKDGILISGADSNSIEVTTAGTYEARVLRGTIWSDWSHTPVVITVASNTKSSNLIVSNDLNEVDINKPSSVNTIAVYPNPSTGYFDLAVQDHADERITVSIFDMSGRNMYMNDYTASKGSNSFRIVTEKNRFHPGIYTLKVYFKTSGETQSIKVVIL